MEIFGFSAINLVELKRFGKDLQSSIRILLLVLPLFKMAEKINMAD
jgi:hypothetical protein